MSQRFSCHKISEGKAQGPALTSQHHIMFYLMQPETGEVIEEAHDLKGKSVSQKVLIFPGGKGSAVVQADGLYQLNMHNNMPAAMVIQYPETVLVSAAVVMEVPMVDRVDPAFYEIVKDGDTVIVDADAGYIEIV